ncbi:MAG: hypothetical protein JOZ09_18625 [Pseudonocardiales bacterium]|nr:hypothetical protein [Pseudonocardiales bacterium]
MTHPSQQLIDLLSSLPHGDRHRITRAAAEACEARGTGRAETLTRALGDPVLLHPLDALAITHQLSDLLLAWRRWHTTHAALAAGATWAHIAMVTGSTASHVGSEFLSHTQHAQRWPNPPTTPTASPALP